MEDRYADYPAATWHRRLVVTVLAVTTAIAVILTIIYPPGGVKRTRPVPADAARCTAGQQEDCVGGRAAVIVPVQALPQAARPSTAQPPAAAASR